MFSFAEILHVLFLYPKLGQNFIDLSLSIKQIEVELSTANGNFFLDSFSSISRIEVERL